MNKETFKIEKSKGRIVALYLLILLAFIMFIATMLKSSVIKQHLPSLYTSSTTKAVRGEIISADGFHIVTTQKLYKAEVDTRCIDPQKKRLFVELFSIYSGIEPSKIYKKLASRKGNVVLSYGLDPKVASYLKSLAYELRQKQVFIEYETPSGRLVLKGLDILESGEARLYPYGKILTPFVGYPEKFEDGRYTRRRGVKGVEKQFNEDLMAREDGTVFAPRDVNNYKILTKESRYKPPLDGLSIQLTIALNLQVKVEHILDQMKRELDADEMITVIMESKSGKIVSLASSNRFLPTKIKRRDYRSLRTGVLEYSFEVGSVIKPLTMALLLELKKTTPQEIVDGHNGRYRIGRKVITDEHPFKWITSENIIVKSSNVGIAQLAQRLNGVEFREGLVRFGLTRGSGEGLPYEKLGSLPSIKQLDRSIYKATASYGYGLLATLMQVVRAYSAFSNEGSIVTPTALLKLIDSSKGEEIYLEEGELERVVSKEVALEVRSMLIKTVEKGTGVGTKTDGLTIGGKTGTAHIASGGKYANVYNSSFVGFVDDAQGRSYTIGVTAIKPKEKYFASQTAVATFKKLIDMMVADGYLTKTQETNESIGS